MTTRGVEHVRDPVVPGATHSVECSACGARLDVAADTDIAARHRHAGVAFTFRKITPTPPPPPPPKPVTVDDLSAITARLEALEKERTPVTE